MLFNSIDFAIFLPIVFILYWSAEKIGIKIQNALLLIASYIFYGWWDYRFLSLIAFSSSVDYVVGIGLSKTVEIYKRKLLLSTSIVINIGILGFFKYYNFFIDNFIETFRFLGHAIHPQGLNIILPVGISFYTFQTVSYSIDVYKRKLEPTQNIVAFFTFVSFFPQLVAGPIERATNLLPQFFKKRYFEYNQAADGMRQILFGLFKKIVIADNCAKYVNDIFTNYTIYYSSTLVLGVILFAFQIYGDFSGYSDIAIGTSRLFGFNLKRNFAFPYFSRDIAEFWRRWHISLTTWFRDYVYIPMGGSRGKAWTKIRNIFFIFLVSGFWHGANWTFIAWGFINALFFIPLMLMNKNRRYNETINNSKMLPSIKEIFQMGITFLIVCFAWIFFRAESMNDALRYTEKLFTKTIFTLPEILPKKLIIFIFLLLSVEWIQRRKLHGLQFDKNSLPKAIRWSIYYGIIGAILYFGGEQHTFIYFQF